MDAPAPLGRAGGFGLAAGEPDPEHPTRAGSEVPIGASFWLTGGLL